MRVSKPLRLILYFLGGLIASLLLIIFLLATIRIPIDLTGQKGMVESAASLALGRSVKVDDKIVITTSLQPIFSLEGLRISNPKNFEKGDFLRMKIAEFQVRVLPLLLGKIKIAKFSVKGLAVMLAENKTGAVNWSPQTPEKSKPEPPPPPKSPSEERKLELTSDSLVLTKLVLEDISVDYRRPDLAEPLQFKIEECTGTMLPGKPFILSIKGKPDVVIELTAPLIQLNDFDVGDWSPEIGDSEKPTLQEDPKKEKDTAASQDPKSSPEEEVEELLSPQVLKKFNVRLNVKAEKVMSGTDELGSGVLTASQKDGRFTLDPMKLNIPGGSFTLAATLKPDPRAPEASVRAVMDKFDFGVLVRRANPKADMGGIINLWAVNVIAAVASGKDNKPYEINCVLGRWTMKEGLLVPNIILIDTTKIRICGKGQVDFKKEIIDLKMAPTPKKPEFFSLATPVEVRGNFDDFGVGIQTGGLFGTTIRFIASPVTVPLARLFTKNLPDDGGDVCGMTIGPENRTVKAPAGCK